MADSADSPELGPPPMSHFIDEDPVKIDSPTRTRPGAIQDSSPKRPMEPPVTLPSPQNHQHTQSSPSPEKKREMVPQSEEARPPKLVLADKPVSQPVKAGSKRKLAVRDDTENGRPQKISNENQPTPLVNDTQLFGDKVGGKSLKESTSIRKEVRVKSITTTGTRKPLAAKSTNDDIASPKKTSKPAAIDEVAAAKADLIRSKASQNQTKSKISNPPAIKVEAIPPPDMEAPRTTDLTYGLGTPLTEPALLSPSSPEPAGAYAGTRGGTPPPTDISSQAETLRPSRRNRTAVSYAEPNLRDKMRRPTKELYDAVTGEARYARRSSHAEQIPPESAKVKRESGAEDSWKQLPQAKTASTEHAPDSIPASPCTGKGSPEDLPSSVTTGRRRRMSSMTQEAEAENDEFDESMDQSTQEATEVNTSETGDVDVYEFQPSSPQPEKQASSEVKRRMGGRKASRRFSTNVRSDDDFVPKERGSRRKSMML